MSQKKKKINKYMRQLFSEFIIYRPSYWLPIYYFTRLSNDLQSTVKDNKFAWVKSKQK